MILDWDKISKLRNLSEKDKRFLDWLILEYYPELLGTLENPTKSEQEHLKYLILDFHPDLEKNCQNFKFTLNPTREPINSALTFMVFEDGDSAWLTTLDDFNYKLKSDDSFDVSELKELTQKFKDNDLIRHIKNSEFYIHFQLCGSVIQALQSWWENCIAKRKELITGA